MLQSLKIPFFLLVALLSACGTTSNITPGTPIKVSPESAILLLGVKPGYRVHLLRGETTSDTWIRPNIDVPEVNLAPNEDGYVVVAIPPTTPGKRLGVATVFPEGKVFGPCEGSIGPTIELEAGKVNYVGTLNYKFSGSSLNYNFEFDESKARRFIDEKFPDLSPFFKARPIVPMKVKTDFCVKKTILIPVYIPG